MFDWDDITEFFDADFAESCEIDGETYDCVRYKSDRVDETAPEGMTPGISFRLMLKTADFATPPANNAKLAFDGQKYLIAAVEKDSTAKAYILTLKYWRGA